MIEARKSSVFEIAFAAYNRRMLRQHFSGLHLSGAEHVAAVDRSLPIIFYGNHSCWWDGLVEFYLGREVFRLESYLMMDETQMAKYGFFRWIGAFSVNRHRPREAYRSVRYAIDLFSAPNRVLWIYPQGVMLPNDVRPLSFSSGITRIVEGLGRAQLLPVTHRYEFLSEQKPDAFTSIGAAELVTAGLEPRSLLACLETTLTRQLDEMRQAITAQDLQRFACVMAGKASVNRRYDRARRLIA